jgi:small nuclear ribonucleoprotein (snRNP)-like protein
VGHLVHAENVLHGLQGFDEYMNLVLDEAEEVSMKRKARKPLGKRPCFPYR